MRLLILVVIAMLAIGAFANDQMGAYIKDHTNQILSTTLPESVPVAQFSDFAAFVTGQSPRYTNSPVPITNKLKRAQASVVFITQDQLPTLTPQITLIETDKSQTQSGAAITAVQGQNKCLLGSKSMFDTAYLNSQNSLVFAFATDSVLAEAFCPRLPTTTPPPSGYTHGSAICATSAQFVGSTDTKYSSPESNSAIANAVALTQTTDFALLESKFGVKVTDAAVIIDGVSYDLQYLAVDNIIKELAYITNVSAQLPQFAQFTADSSPDYFTFVISSAQKLNNNTQLIALIEAVVQDAISAFATAYKNSLLSTVIQTKTPLTSVTCAVADVATLGATADQNTVTYEQVRSYQIVLWLVITLIVVAIGGFCATMTMHIQPDSALQGGVSTYWTQKRSA